MSSLNRRTFLGASAAAVAGVAVAQGQQDSAAKGDNRGLLRTPHTKFAANLEMWWTKLPFLQRIEEAAKLGFPAVEFWGWRDRDFAMDDVLAATRRLGLKIAQISGANGLNDPKQLDKILADIDASCQTARKLETNLVCVVAGQDIPGMTQDEMHGHVITALRRAAPIAEKHGCTLMLEPFNIRVDHPGHCLYGSPAALRIVRAVNSPNVKILWDLYHLHITEGDLCGRLREGFEWVAYLQIADHPGRTEPGTGEIHYNRVLKEAYDLGYRGYVGVECRPKTDELTAARAVAAADAW